MSNTYHIDDRAGDDGSDGRSAQTAWRTCAPASGHVFEPGDQLLLRRGGHWAGMLAPRGQGAPGRPIVLGAYGDGPLPLIDGAGAEAAVKLCCQSHWVVRDLHAQNHSAERAVRHGIFLCGGAEGIARDVVVERCEISHVDGENRRAMPTYASMYWNGGIYVSMPGRSSESAHWEDVLIQDNHIHDVRTSGIRIAQQEDFVIDIHHRGAVVRRNRIERTGSDGMIVANCVAPLIEDNLCHDAGALGTLQDTRLIAGIWVCAVSDALIRRNEVARTRLFENDGTAFDTDWGVCGTITFENNYAHDNEGGFFLDCGGLNLNPGYVKTVLRGNVSVNDQRCIVQDAHSPCVELEGNLFYQERGNAPVAVCLHQPGDQHRYRDNVFAFPDPPANGWQSVDMSQNRWVRDWVKPPAPPSRLK